MAISISFLQKIPHVPMPNINPHLMGAGVLGGFLLLTALKVLLFGDPMAGQTRYVLAIPPAAQTASLSGHLRADNGHGSAPDMVIQIGASEPHLAGLDDPSKGTAHGGGHERAGNTPTHIASNTDHGPSPDAALVEPGPGGVLPIIAADGRRPADVYARPFDTANKTPAIALIVGGLGLKKSTTLAAIQDLPPEVTLSFVPYTHDLQNWINQARAAGHEVMLELPMEPFDYPQNDPGPQTLLSTVSSAENTRRLEWLLSRAWGYFAVTNYMGSKFTASETALSPVMRQLRQRGIDFIYDGEARRSSLGNVAKQERLRWTTADRIIDTEPSTRSIEEQLLHLEAIAIQNGSALGAGFSWPITIKELQAWTQTVSAKGYVLAPASAVLNARNGTVEIEAPNDHDTQMVASSGH
ncbi:MAG: hypothetical protein COA84_05860 [Robiginitomaculum sp.]|nr:MAG: hypothetical protein COA84_05860 [Robiginitomaculum sp.]